MPADAVRDIGGAAATGGAIGGPVGAGIGAGAGLIAYLIGRGADKEAAAIQKAAADAYGNVSDEAVQRAAAQILGPSALAQIRQDPSYKAAQDEGLAALKRISDSGGLTLTDRANLNDVQASNAQRANSARQGQLADLGRRGMLGSGAEIASSLANQQGEANRNSREGQRIAATAQDRALQAIRDRAQLGGQMQTADWNRQSQVAGAQDAISRFNNEAGYNRAQDAYGRALDKAAHAQGAANVQAGNTRAAGDRDQAAVAGVGRGLQKIATGDSFGGDPASDDTSSNGYGGLNFDGTEPRDPRLDDR